MNCLYDVLHLFKIKLIGYKEMISAQAKQIAQYVRKWAEKHSRLVKNKDFDIYNLDCMCGYASTILFVMLKEHQIENVKFHSTDTHCYLTIDDVIVDITATQFHSKLKTVYISKRNKLFDKQWYKYAQVYHSLEDIYKAMHHTNTETGFPESQFFSNRTQLNRAIKSARAFIEKQNSNLIIK